MFRTPDVRVLRDSAESQGEGLCSGRHVRSAGIVRGEQACDQRTSCKYPSMASRNRILYCFGVMIVGPPALEAPPVTNGS
jgi:hypothetical protein